MNLRRLGERQAHLSLEPAEPTLRGPSGGRKCLWKLAGGCLQALILVSLASTFIKIQTATCRLDIPHSAALNHPQQGQQQQLYFQKRQQDQNHHRARQQPADGGSLHLVVAPAAAGSAKKSEIMPLVALSQLQETISDKQLVASADATGSVMSAAAASASAPSDAAAVVPLQANSSGSVASNEESMKFPLYMRITATSICLIIFTIGVCGNLLVPLVVIKTKYLRNSTNLFLINLSVADLLVLIVCMPTVLIELHSRPETWLLGEPMCKLSNFVEMLAANGSIFTILAISLERYYAICKPLKAGYKCTRLRAAQIICCIWILSTILTSPILMMAKSSQTIYIDGSLVYNCILETDTYWHKMYVFVSMIAFFCLPLIVLMLLYWLIGRRLIRENLALSTTTSLATSDSVHTGTESNTTTTCGHHLPNPDHQPYQHCHLHSPSSTICAVRKRVGGLRKGASFKSISSSLFSLLHHQTYHQISQNQHQQHEKYKQTAADTCATTKPPTLAPTDSDGGHQIRSSQAAGPTAVNMATSMSTRQRRCTLKASKTLSLDHQFITQSANDAAQNRESLQPSLASFNSHGANPSFKDDAGPDVTHDGCGRLFDSGNNLDNEQAASEALRGRDGLPIKGSLANQFVYHLFHIKSMRRNGKDNLSSMAPKETLTNLRQTSFDNSNDDGGSRRQFNGTRSVNEMRLNSSCMCSYPTTGSELINDDHGSQTPFITTLSQKHGSMLNGPLANDHRLPGPRDGSKNGRRFYWAKRFSVSSSSASMQTNCTNLPSESSVAPDSSNLHCNNSGSQTAPVQVSPRPIIHCESFQRGHRLLLGAKKSAHFSVGTADNSSPSPPVCSSACESSASSSSSASASASTYSSKSPSPDPLFEQTPLRGGHLHQANGIKSHQHHDALGSSKAKSSQYLLTTNSSMVEEVDEEELNDIEPPSSDTSRGETVNFVTESCSTNQVESDKQISKTLEPLMDNGGLVTMAATDTMSVSQDTQNNNNNNDYKRAKSKLPIRKGKSLDHKARETQHHYNFHFNLRRANTRCGTQSTVCAHHNNNNHNHHHQPNNHPNEPHLSKLMVVQDLSKKQQMDSRRQVVVMLAFVVACFFLLFFPYRVFTVWLILSTEDQVQSLGMETYYNLTYFSRILIYLHSAINPIAYNLISTKFKRAFMSILLCRGSSTRRHFTTEPRFITNKSVTTHNHRDSVHIDFKKHQLKHITSNQ